MTLDHPELDAFADAMAALVDAAMPQLEGAARKARAADAQRPAYDILDAPTIAALVLVNALTAWLIRVKRLDAPSAVLLAATALLQANGYTQAPAIACAASTAKTLKREGRLQ